jgi:NADH-quinone oxidoreductase subunit K
MVPISYYLVLSGILFACGVLGFLIKRNIITIFMSIELMLNAVNLSFVTFSYQHKEVSGHLFTFFVMVVAAAEAAVGLAIILTVFKGRSTLNIDDVNSMKN